MTEQTDTLREQLAAALGEHRRCDWLADEVGVVWSCGVRDEATDRLHHQANAMLAVVAARVDVLTAERDDHRVRASDMADEAKFQHELRVQAEAEVAALRETVDRVKALLRVAEYRDAQSIGRDFTGRPFKVSIPQEDLRAALGVTE